MASSSERSNSLAAPRQRRQRHNSASRSSISSGSTKNGGSSVRSRSKSNDASARQPKFPRMAIENPENADTDEDCVVFLAELYEFLLETYRVGITRSGKLHPEVNSFVDKYGTNLMYSVQECTKRICQNEPVFNKVVGYQPHVFADIIHLCTKHLTGKIQAIKKKNNSKGRSKEEQVLDELFAAPLLALLLLVNSPRAHTPYAKACLESCYGDCLHYLLLVPHRCQPTAECHCYQMAGPVEHAIEQACLPAGAKYTSQHVLNSQQLLQRHYAQAIAFNYVLACSILMMKGVLQPVVDAFDKIVDDLDALRRHEQETSRSLLIVRTGVGEFVAQGQASDFVVVCLDMILKRLASKQPELFTSRTVDVLESYYVQQRPQSCLLALEVLKTLASTRPKLVAGRRKLYLDTAQQLQLPDKYIKQIQNLFT